MGLFRLERALRSLAQFSFALMLASCMVEDDESLDSSFDDEEVAEAQDALAGATKLPQTQLSIVSSTMSLTNASKVFDGSTGTRWVMDPTAWPQEFVVSLGGSYSVAAIDVFESWSRIGQYDLYVGAPGTWGAPVKSGTVPGSGLQELSFTPKTGSHVRVVVKSSSNGGTYAYLSELNVHVTTPTATPKLWTPHDLSFTSSGTPDWKTFPLTATFTHTSGTQIKLEGYWDGGKSWKVRFTPTKTGSWSWVTASSDSGLNAKTGSLSVAAPSAGQITANRNLRGHLRIASDKRTFNRADGTPMLYLGDTGWRFSSTTHAKFEDWVDDRKAKGFTVAQVNYVSPTLDNSGGYPFSSSGGATDNGNYSQINPGFFQELDTRMQYLFTNGFVVAGHPGWLTNTPFYDLTEAKNLARYLLARYGAYPTVWSVTGEYHLSLPYWADNNYDRVRQLGAFMKTKNVYGAPLSVHPGESSADDFHSEPWLDHNWLQTYDSPQNIPQFINAALSLFSPAKPVIESEGQYEDIPSVSAPADLQRRQAWVSLLSGAAGFVYGAHPIFSFSDMSKLALPGAQDVSRVASFFNQNGFNLSQLNPKVAAGQSCVKVNGSNASLLNQTHARCAGKSGTLYVLYAPTGSAGHSLEMRGLANKQYKARWYNPATGSVSNVNGGNPINTDLNDTWAVPARPSSGDWVLWLTP